MVPSFKNPRLDEPQLFYLGTSGLDALADGRIKHGKSVLPFHSQILAAQSSVLRDMFCSLRTTKGSAAEAKMIELKTPFKDFTLEEVIWFLRFVYHVTEATAANFRSAAEHAPGIIRLAHSLDMSGPLMSAADAYVRSEMTGVQAALKWLPLTETCGLQNAWSRGIRVIAVEMATGSGGSRAPHVAAKVLSSTLNQDSIIAIMAALAATCRKSPTVSDCDVPAAALLADWKAADLPPGDTEYTYTLTEFSTQLSPMRSPKFEAAGYKWQLHVTVTNGNVGLFLHASTPMWFPVAYTLELIDQLTGKVLSKLQYQHTFSDHWGQGNFFELNVLRSTPGYIVNDTVKFRVRISVDV